MEEQKIASLWSRMGGAFIDLIFVLLITAVVLIVWGFFIGLNGSELYIPKSESQLMWKARGLLTGLLVDCVYNVLMMAGEKQSTFGQRAVGIKIVKDSGDSIGYGTAIGRWVVSIFSSVLLKIGYLIAVFSKNKKTLHDLVIGTTVIQNIKKDEVSDRYRQRDVESPTQYTTKVIDNNYTILDFQLKTSDFMKKYEVNDYDLAKAKNEMQGNLHNVQIDANLMNECRATTQNEREAAKKYLLLRAYQISKSQSRNEPHIATAPKQDDYAILKINGSDIYRNESNIGSNEKESGQIFTWKSFSLGVFVVILGLWLFFSSSNNDKKQNIANEPSNNKEMVKPQEKNFFNSDMSYTLRDCKNESGESQQSEYEKIKTSIEDRNAILIGKEKRSFFETCFLNGRYYECTSKVGTEKTTKITLDVIEMYYWQEEINEIGEAILKTKIGCDVHH